MSTPDDRFAPPPPPGVGGFDAPTAAVPVVPASTRPPTPPLPPNREASGVKTAGLAFLATLVAVGIVAAAFFLGRSGDSATPVTTVMPPPTTTTEATSSTTAPPATTAPPVTSAPIGEVRQAPAGLLCKDLNAQGYSYSDAVDYWRVNGQPDRMDADKNGIPCETVYPRSDVVAYWPAATYEASVSYGLPSGLLCRDLQARGVGVYDAVRYYIWEGFPARMDADGNGIPCETVYSDAAAAWLDEF